MRRQAEAGDTDAMTNLASGLLASSRDGEAEHWYRKAAQAGNAEAMTGLPMPSSGTARPQTKATCSP